MRKILLITALFILCVPVSAWPLESDRQCLSCHREIKETYLQSRHGVVFGMKQADGPKLAGTSKTLEQVMKHIKDGKSPMPSFKSQLTDKEIQALSEYIKGLPGD